VLRHFWNLFIILNKRRNSDIATKIRPISRIDDPSIVDIAASTDIPSEEFFTTLKVLSNRGSYSFSLIMAFRLGKRTSCDLSI